jgi:purine nucleosidase
MARMKTPARRSRAILRSSPALVGLLAFTLIGGAAQSGARIRVILDSDANNEMDDQYAIAYMLFNQEVFDVEGITVNRTRGGGGLDQHAAEAERIVRLSGARIPVTNGASGSLDEIKDRMTRPDFDGADAVNLIVRRAHATDQRRLVLLPIGKLTNIALALRKDPEIARRVRIVWLGSNYPEPGEYNQENDEGALKYLLDADVEFEIALVRYGKPSGTAAVQMTREEARAKLPGRGPRIETPVTGRHGGQFQTFGDYAVELFEKMPGRPQRRALFDMAAVAIVKNPAWARAVKVPAPALVDGRWVERPGNRRTITLWQDFNREAILGDFYASLEKATRYR